MDERRLEPHRGFERLSDDLGKFAEALLALAESAGGVREAAE